MAGRFFFTTSQRNSDKADGHLKGFCSEDNLRVVRAWMTLLVAIFFKPLQASVLIHNGVRPEALRAKGETTFDVCGVLVH